MAGKIFKDVTLLQQHVDNLKQQQNKIVFTNGGFNILHVGHIRSLQDAKAGEMCWWLLLTATIRCAGSRALTIP